ncbi:HNH endonuclease signature motif containing protein [Granulosicoccus antarcticus]|uniref:HNH nuclease domain-containing protein n=1 Tax=Granulosicoccus antarcticus IMCC3135 TaxID=1192854 RepID=A0A2Z2NLB9_9GAMM|nr:HNH endonuclease signature motif containing protein [Granulosicoccus antarcticus]ASJ72242.1 hypothetical protein IMCC3135_10750 [Granulosicoccus antarcticus IMCC3135]
MDDSINQSHHEHADTTSHVQDEIEVETDNSHIPFGTDSFDAEARESFGRNLRLFMSLTDGSTIAPQTEHAGKAMPDEVPAIALRLKQLGQDLSSGMADQLELLVRFDNLGGWKSSGSRHCVAWMNLEMGISPALAWEYLRVGRKLQALPITRALFSGGRLTWSIVRLLSRVANEDNEALLCHTALDAAVSDVERLCNEYRWQQDADQYSSDGENARSLQQIETRSFSWNTVSNGNTLIKLALPPEVAQAFLNGIEQSLAQLEETDASMSQRRADAAVLMAENSLQNAGREMATADRYQVIVSVDESELNTSNASTPGKRPTVQNAGPIATDTARRLACDCSVSTVTLKNGEPIDIGRKSRLWPAAMARAIKNRDQHCQYPGCTQTRHLQIHHIHHWADGGTTSVENGACLCAFHHTIVHKGGYRIERINDHPDGYKESFHRQQATRQNINDIESLLRNSHDSFEKVRELSPTRFRFRVVNQEGQDIRDTNDSSGRQNPSPSDTHSTGVERSFYPPWPGVAEKAPPYRVSELCF